MLRMSDFVKTHTHFKHFQTLQQNKERAGGEAEG